jgi:hypothetical protein
MHAFAYDRLFSFILGILFIEINECMDNFNGIKKAARSGDAQLKEVLARGVPVDVRKSETGFLFGEGKEKARQSVIITPAGEIAAESEDKDGDEVLARLQVYGASANVLLWDVVKAAT